jgi:serine/threonine protein phosphatase PrpC
MALKVMHDQPLTVRIASASDGGKQREHNEDAAIRRKRQKRAEQTDGLRDQLSDRL